jgi:ABC-type multidrug transport system fused ATPase/permease subunit
MNTAFIAKVRGTSAGIAFGQLRKQEKNRVLGLAVIQFMLGMLDLFGVVFVGALGALSINGINSRAPGERVSFLLRALRIDSWQFEAQAIFLAVMAILVLVGRTLLSVFFTRKTLHFLARKSAEISTNLFDALIHSNITQIQSEPTQKILYAINRGVDTLIVQILGTFITLTADFTSLLVIVAALFIVDPIIALTTIVLFGIIGSILYYLMHTRAKKYGLAKTESEIKANQKVLEAIDTYRELFVRNCEQYYVKRIGELRLESARAIAEVSFMPSISKFVLESLVLIGAVIIGISQFMLHDAFRAIGTLSVFLAAGTRIAPALLRVQQGALAIRSGSGQIEPTLRLIDSLQFSNQMPKTTSRQTETSRILRPKITLDGVSFKYYVGDSFGIQDISLQIPEGKITAIVGSSGAGKSTLVDLLLGVLQPSIGTVKIDNDVPVNAIRNFPGVISYVPQEIVIADCSIRENVGLGYAVEKFSDYEIWAALKLANLEDVILKLKDGLETKTGEYGFKLSGGQRQRLGLARAIVTNPKILVLDEATSALDAETEDLVNKAILNLRNKTTIVIIAHRLSSVRNADQVIYMDNGSVLAQGTFAEVRMQVPDFDKQSKLMGL